VARLGRGVPVPPVLSRTRPVSFDNSVSPSAFSTPFRYPVDRTASLGAFSTAFSYPALTVTAPHVPGSLITVDGEIEFNAFLMSPLNSYRPLDDLEGWDDLPGVDNGDEERPSRQGAYPGEQILQERIISATIQLRDTATFAASLRAIRAVIKPKQDGTENALAIRTAGETLVVYGKVTKRIVKADYGLGVADISVQWVCSDARRYGTSFNVSTIVGSGTLTNAGDEDTSPRYRFYGPVNLPRLSLPDPDDPLADPKILAFNVSLGTGEQLDVNTDTGSTLITTTSGTTNYAPLSNFSVSIEDFALPPGDNTITYVPDSGGALGVTAFWRDAYS
jgi:hypothetical protein